MVKPSFRVHWLRYTTQEGDPDNVAADITGVIGGEFGPVQKRGAYNQPMSMKHTCGASIYFGSHVERQPIVVDVPGDACDQLTSRDLATCAANSEGSVTRIDVAADVEPADLARTRLKEMRRVFGRGHCDTRIPKTSMKYYVDHRPDQGHTLYVGSSASEAFMRAYDRRGPLRIEWQWTPTDRTMRQAIPTALLRRGPGDLWRQVSQRCVWPMAWIQQLYEGPTLDLEAPPQRISDLASTVLAIQAQYGEAIWVMMNLCGVGLGEIAKPAERPSREQEFRRHIWPKQAREAGYLTPPNEDEDDA